MNVTLSNIIVFTAGVAVGSLATWKLVKDFYKKRSDEEIASVVETFEQRNKPEESEPEQTEIPKEGTPTTYERYKDSIFEFGYDGELKDETSATIEEDDCIHVIAPEEFGDLEDEGYAKVSLTYYVDELLADFYDNIVDDVAHTVGKDFAEHFGEYEDDSVFVRNDKKKIDYEILSDPRTYDQAVIERRQRRGEE